MIDLRTILLRKSLLGLYLAAGMFLTVIVVGIIAYSIEGWPFSDAVYMVVITVFSVGYEEVEPVNTAALRAITMCIIVAGDASKVYFVGSLIQFITEGEIGKAMEEHRKSRDVGKINKHAIICGYGRIGQTLARELAAKKFPLVVVDSNADRVTLAQDHGHLALIGDGGEEATLTEAGIERAEVLTAVLPNDMANVFITLTARNMRTDLRIISRAEDPATEKKLKQAGANEIILPAFVGGMQIANSITHPSLDTILKDEGGQLRRDLGTMGVEIVEHVVLEDGLDDRKTLHGFLRGVESTTMVLAVKKANGTVVQHPEGNYRLEAKDVVTMLAHRGGKGA